MPVSKKQHIANFKNAQKSTGPKTEQGMEISSRNATKHGLYSNDIIIDSPHLNENKADYDSLLNSLIEELKPQTLFQEQLVWKIANCLWRSRRVLAAEICHINRQQEEIDSDIKTRKLIDQLHGNDDDSPETEFKKEARDRHNFANIKSIPDGTFSLNIMRYEMRLDRQLTRAYKLLQYLQFQQVQI